MTPIRPRRRWSGIVLLLLCSTRLYSSFSLEDASPATAPQIQAIWYRETNNILHWSCRVEVSSSSFDDDELESRRQCCRAIRDVLKEKCRQTEESSSPSSSVGVADTVQLCEFLEQLAPSYREKLQDMESLMARVPIRFDDSLAVYYYSLLLSLTPQQAVWNHDPTVLTTRDSSNDLPNLYLHENHGQWTTEPAPMPWWSNDIPNSEETSAAPGNVLHANVRSRLSSTGGMHRHLHTEIGLTTATRAPRTVKHASLTLLLFVTQDVFLDMDDIFVGDCGITISDGSISERKCRASLVESVFLDNIMPPRIDIEQPAFVSPQHVVAVRMDLEESEDDDHRIDNCTLHVTTQIHARYPQPIASGRYRSFVLPAPVLVGGECEVGESSSETCRVRVTSIAEAPILVHVAAGYEKDYMWTTVATFLCSLVGSAILLREIVRVSRWD